MSDLEPLPAFRSIDKLRPLDETGRFSKEEVVLASRNRGMPLEALRYKVTPTGLHYLLTHFDIPLIDATDWRLDIDGLSPASKTLDLEAIKALPAVTRPVTMECAGNGRSHMSPRPVSQPWMEGAISTASWTGTLLRNVLPVSDVMAGAREVLLTGLDAGMEGGELQRYQRSLAIDDDCLDEAMLVYAMNGQPLEPQHGAPLRLIVPGWYGMTSVKWLCRIEVIDHDFDGHYMIGTYRYRNSVKDLGEPVKLQRVRSLMAPPGLPDFFSRRRLVEPGPHQLVGRAWAGKLSVDRVEVSSDGGGQWHDAELEAMTTPGCWQGWLFSWNAKPGETVLMVRATDAEGQRQPLAPIWNHQGFGNNAVQRVEVVVA